MNTQKKDHEPHADGTAVRGSEEPTPHLSRAPSHTKGFNSIQLHTLWASSIKHWGVQWTSLFCHSSKGTTVVFYSRLTLWCNYLSLFLSPEAFQLLQRGGTRHNRLVPILKIKAGTITISTILFPDYPGRLSSVMATPSNLFFIQHLP